MYRQCPGPPSRRDLLRLGLLGGAAGFSLSDLLRLRSAAASTQTGAPGTGDTSVILVFCLGGMSHLETYDLKPDGPEQMRSVFKPIATRV